MNSIFYYALPTILLLALIRKYQEYKWGKCTNNVQLNDKVVLITGANSGIGLEVARELAKRGARVILACRNFANVSNALKDLKATIKEPCTLIPMQVDLASIESIKKFAEEVRKKEKKIDILINNAGVAYPKNDQVTTRNGLEIHFGVNHLAHFLLTTLLLPTLKASPSCRVIVVSSTLHQKGNIYLDDLNLQNREGKTAGYNNSKLANAYFAKELARRVADTHVKVYCLCPGWVYTALFRYYNVRWYHYLLVAPIAFFFMRTPKQGAQTIVYCATQPELENETGMFYRDCKHFKSSVNFDPEIAKKLWDATEKMIESKAKVI